MPLSVEQAKREHVWGGGGGGGGGRGRGKGGWGEWGRRGALCLEFALSLPSKVLVHVMPGSDFALLTVTEAVEDQVCEGPSKVLQKGPYERGIVGHFAARPYQKCRF